MATLVPLNTFKTITSNVYTNDTILYTTPIETATIILTAQVSNITDRIANVTVIHRSNVLSGGFRVITDTELVNRFDVNLFKYFALKESIIHQVFWALN